MRAAYVLTPITCVQIGVQLTVQGGEEDTTVCWSKTGRAGGEGVLLHCG